MARGKGEGTIYERKKGQWAGQITLPDGKRKTFYGANKADVLRKMNKARHDLDKGLPLADGQQTIVQYLTWWLDSVEHDLKPGTFRAYGNLVKHITNSLGSVRLKDLTPQQVKYFHTQEIKRGFSPTTVNHIHHMLHKALEDAYKLNLVPGNACDRIKAPRRASHEMVTLSEQDARLFLETAQGHRLEALFVLALQTGMREGELLGLRWADVNLERGYLTVRSSIQRANQTIQLGEPKTAHSRRKIELSASATQALRAHRKQQKEEKLQSLFWQEHDLVFPTSCGTLMYAENLLARSFKPLLQKAGLPPMRFHDLRHTAATLLLARGENPKAVSEMLGHADVAITLRVYGHVTQTMHAHAATTMDAIFG